MNKDRRRSSIHDITSVNNGDVSVPQGPITGQTNCSATGTSGKSNKPPSQTPAAPSGVGVYGAPTIGQPIGPLVSAVGTPVNLPPGHMAYGVRAPVPGQVVPGAPMNMGPMTYPMPHTSAHRGRGWSCISAAKLGARSWVSRLWVFNWWRRVCVLVVLEEVFDIVSARGDLCSGGLVRRRRCRSGVRDWEAHAKVSQFGARLVRKE
ncbi:hypothetical protein TEA_021939 [Camellia sinensis var. sinensis]|uniref:Uncharacterized protein n=1 Tax=Camellia sinensis var. sinensis TaxID=542762 RepID=A0A4S4D9D2_CAMSN|nr:hypothetical protein TEA_021939 [Camellia sinensis var. sinensis]